jgi:four helix bundle suffix protein
MATEDDGLIRPHGGYRYLLTFQLAELIYDCTVRFCDAFIDKKSRTHDQMVQAARSGVQNIAEGSMASGTSKKSELKLTGVARASLEELLLDYNDYLRQRGLRIWAPKDEHRDNLVRCRPGSAQELDDWVTKTIVADNPSGTPGRSEVARITANSLIMLIEICTRLLRRQLDAQAKQFETEGGFTERLYQNRKRARDEGR